MLYHLAVHTLHIPHKQYTHTHITVIPSPTFSLPPPRMLCVSIAATMTSSPSPVLLVIHPNTSSIFSPPYKNIYQLVGTYMFCSILNYCISRPDAFDTAYDTKFFLFCSNHGQYYSIILQTCTYRNLYLDCSIRVLNFIKCTHLATQPGAYQGGFSRVSGNLFGFYTLFETSRN